MTATIKDIAKKVGVSPSTVSRVINGTASISEETKKKINRAMEELDYHPNSRARSLVNGSTFTIGLVIDGGNRDAFSNTFFIQSVLAIEMIAQERGYNLLITNDSNRENKNAVKNLILENKVDGIILPVSGMTDELVQLMLSKNFPFVIMGEPDNYLDQVYWVDVDNEQGGYLTVTHLLNQGYEHPVLFVENKGTMFERKRSLGFQRGYESNNRVWDKKNIVECGITDDSVIPTIQQLLEGKMVADSIVCTNNTVAYYVLRELKKGGKSIPRDIGIIAFDNYPLAEYVEPALTVIDVDTYKLGEKAAIVLFDQIQKSGKVAKKTLVSTQIIERESTNRKKW